MKEQWLEWAIELQSLAQAGLTYGKDIFDRERYERIREISAEIMAYKTDIPVQKVKDLFCNETGYQTPKLDTRAAIFQNGKILLVKENSGKWSLPGGWVDVNVSVKENIETTGFAYFSENELPELATEKNNEEQVKMCFEAYRTKNWSTLFD